MPVPPTPLKPYRDFKEALALRESSGDYACVNAYGFLGRYQFGLARLTDLGLCEKKDGRFVWREPFSEARFLACPPLQERVFDAHVTRLRVVSLMNFKGAVGRKLETGVVLTVSGMIAAMHLVGPGGFAKFLRGETAQDALGTTALEYASLFSGYDIPSDLPLVPPRELEAYVASAR